MTLPIFVGKFKTWQPVTTNQSRRDESQISPPAAPYSDIAGTRLHCSPKSDAAAAPDVLAELGASFVFSREETKQRNPVVETT